MLRAKRNILLSRVAVYEFKEAYWDEFKRRLT